MSSTPSLPPIGVKEREQLLRILAAITFLIFFQGYMVAPMIPRLAIAFGESEQRIGLIVPAYLIPYGISTLFFGLLSDWIGRKRIMLFSLLAFAGLTALTATSVSATQMILWRLFTGLGASGVVPLALALIGTLFPFRERGRPLGWLFGAMAGGMAFGSTLGVILEPMIGFLYERLKMHPSGQGLPESPLFGVLLQRPRGTYLAFWDVRTMNRLMDSEYKSLCLSQPATQ